MANRRLYGFWGHLSDALRTGLPQNEIKGGQDLFAALYNDPARLEGFLKAMTGVSLPTARSIAGAFDWRHHNAATATASSADSQARP